MKLRTHLIILVIAALLPSLILTAVMLVYFNNQQRRAVENRLTGLSLGVSLALDHEFEESISVLQALGASEHLELGNLKHFYEQAQRVMKTQPYWTTIILFDPSGRQRMNLLRPYGSPLPRDPPSNPGIENTVELKQPLVSDVFVGRLSAQPQIAVNVPIIRNGRVEHVLAANISPTSLRSLLQERNIPGNWLVTIIDRNGLIVARKPAHEKHVAKPESLVMVAEIQKTEAGVLRAIHYEGEPVYARFQRSARSGWTVVLAAPVSAVEAPLLRTLMLVAGGGLALIVLGIVLAGFLSRRITTSIYSLSTAADTLAGEDPAAAAAAAAASGSGRQIAEVTRVAQAIREATLSRIQAHQQIEDNLARLRALHQIDVAIGSSLDTAQAWILTPC